MKKLFTCLVLLSCFITTVCVATQDVTTMLIKANKIIPTLDLTIAEIKKHSTIPVLFPQLLPDDMKHPIYYSSVGQLANPDTKSYLMNIDYTPDCKGVHVCNVGYLLAKLGEKPTMMNDMQNKSITEIVTLAKNIQGYYTPGHAMGSYFPPSLQWEQNGVLYTLSWDDHLAKKDTMIIMANSAIAAGER